MHFILLVILVTCQICTSTVLFRLTSKNPNVSIDFAYFLGTIHVIQDRIWPYFSNETINILNESEEIWVEHDFTDPHVSKHIYECAIAKMTPKLQSRIREKTWSEFLNETSNNNSSQSNNTEQWRTWFIKKQSTTNNYLSRNRTIGNDIIFDHRIILEGYLNKKFVGSLESIPDDCFQIVNPINGTDSWKPINSKQENFLSLLYNCGLVADDFINEIYKYLDLIKMKYRNQQMMKQIRKLLQTNPHKKYLFAVGSAHLFGNISIIQMLQEQYQNDYHIERLNITNPYFTQQNCSDNEFQRLINEMNFVSNNTIGKRFLNNELFNQLSASFF
ncbi:hypothetical protein I4U23_027833 [Adineta vaga]|nr:hypothetical protein I4U23_027833 [Adineta vaga]